MKKQISGIHHITGIAGDPQSNVDFYSGVLGLRLVKLTVNFDDPGTYHLYYGDGVGSPGTILTFFPWPNAPRGRRGFGQVAFTSFAIPSGAMSYWTRRLAEHGIPFTGPADRFGEQALSCSDPDGLGIEVIESSGIDPAKMWSAGPVPAEYAIHGFHSATLAEEGYERTAALLSETMGFRVVAQEGSRFRYAAGEGAPGRIVDVLCVPEEPPGRIAVGTIHHIAFRTPDGANQRAWAEQLRKLAYNVTPVIDRKYFESIYFREPGSILFEIATDPPGFTVDEPLEALGSKLQLPPWLEGSRTQLERVLPPLRLPSQARRTAP